MKSAILCFALCLPSLATGGIVFDASMESGNATGFSETAPGTWRFEIEPDTNSTDRQWFMFGVNGAQGQTLTFNLEGIDQTNVRNHWGLAHPLFSVDGGDTWELTEGPRSNTSTVFTFSHAFTVSDEMIAFHHPYTHTRVMEKVTAWSAHPDVTHSVLTQSIEGRDIDFLRITDSSQEPMSGKVGFWVIARQHAAEVTGSWMMEGLIDFLLSDDPDAVLLRQRAVFNLVPMMNPDGVVAGNYRDNALGFNLNREWDSASVQESPSVLAVINDIDQWVTDGNRYDFFADLHSTSGATNNYAFHAALSVEPPLYPTPETYSDDLKAFLQIVAHHAPDFDPEGGSSTSPSMALSRQHQMFTYGVLAVIFEGTYNHVDYGPQSGEVMTPARHRHIGEGFARALREQFLPPVTVGVTTTGGE